jgi:hypothetical protein
MRNDGRSDATNISILGRALVVPNGACSKFDYPRQSSFILDAPVLRAGEVFPNQQTGSEFKPIEVDVIVTDDKGNKLMYTPELDRDIFMLHRKEVVTYATISYGDFVADYTRSGLINA